MAALNKMWSHSCFCNGAPCVSPSKYLAKERNCSSTALVMCARDDYERQKCSINVSLWVSGRAPHGYFSMGVPKDEYHNVTTQRHLRMMVKICGRYLKSRIEVPQSLILFFVYFWLYLHVVGWYTDLVWWLRKNNVKNVLSAAVQHLLGSQVEICVGRRGGNERHRDEKVWHKQITNRWCHMWRYETWQWGGEKRKSQVPTLPGS